VVTPVTVRKQLEQDVLELMEEAECYLKQMREERLPFDHPRFLEWSAGVESLLWNTFGELSSHTRTWLAVFETDATPHVYYGRLADCLHRARRALAQSGMPNPLLEAGEWFTLPEFLHNRRRQQKRRAEQARWELFWAWAHLERHKL
jgi:hypothetical protein